MPSLPFRNKNHAHSSSHGSTTLGAAAGTLVGEQPNVSNGGGGGGGGAAGGGGEGVGIGVGESVAGSTGEGAGATAAAQQQQSQQQHLQQQQHVHQHQHQHHLVDDEAKNRPLPPHPPHHQSSPSGSSIALGSASPSVGSLPLNQQYQQYQQQQQQQNQQPQQQNHYHQHSLSATSGQLLDGPPLPPKNANIGGLVTTTSTSSPSIAPAVLAAEPVEQRFITPCQTVLQPHQFQQHLYAGYSNPSLDDLGSSSIGSLHHQHPQPPPPPAPQPAGKKSTRKRLKGIFQAAAGRSEPADNHHLQIQHPAHIQYPQSQLTPPYQSPPQPYSSPQTSSHLAPVVTAAIAASSTPLPSTPTSHSAYESAAKLVRRASQRLSNPPPLRPVYSQLSPDQQVEWQSPTRQATDDDLFDEYSNNNPQQQQQQQPQQYQQQYQQQQQYQHQQQYQQQYHPHQYDNVSIHPSIEEEPDLDYSDQVSYQENLYPSPEPDQAYDQFGQPIGQAIFDPSATQRSQQQFAPPTHYRGVPPHLYNRPLGISHHNPETSSQLSYESPIESGPQATTVLHSPPSINFPDQQQQVQQQQAQPLPPQQQPLPDQQLQQQQQPPSPGLAAAPSAQQMAPGQTSVRRSQETEKTLRAQDSGQINAQYRHSTNLTTPMNPLAPQTQTQHHGDRAGGQYEDANRATGRSSPQPSNAEPQAADDKSLKTLLTKYKNVKRLYFEGKSQIESLNGQVEQLQNALANQRMSQSRTALDDNEYTTRFNRLNGAINNLSFNIRKDWKLVPTWLRDYVRPDAIKTGKQEMTAVGRAVVTRWIVEEIFNKCFHPGLDPNLSRHLKEIELSIRRNSYTLNSQEEFDALTSKVVHWRMATLDGMQAVLGSPDCAQNKADFILMSTTNLTAYLYQFLNDPPPAGVDGSASMMVELAVSIAVNLPLESRDVAIAYPLPGEPVQPHLMEVEKAGLPALDTAKSDLTEGEGAGGGAGGAGAAAGASGENWPKDGKANAAGGGSNKDHKGQPTNANANSSSGNANAASNANSNSMLSTGSQSGRKSATASPNPAGGSDATFGQLPAKDTVRFAGFVALEVRGRQVLMKAPVWTI